jgi:hypothetical protein
MNVGRCPGACDTLHSAVIAWQMLHAEMPIHKAAAETMAAHNDHASDVPPLAPEHQDI